MRDAERPGVPDVSSCRAWMAGSRPQARASDVVDGRNVGGRRGPEEHEGQVQVRRRHRAAVQFPCTRGGLGSQIGACGIRELAGDKQSLGRPRRVCHLATSAMLRRSRCNA